MTEGLEFTVDRNANPASDEVRAEILANPGFGKFHTDHMVSIDYTVERGWHDARVIPYGPIELDPSAIVLHYAQEIFEGLKAYRWADGAIVSFRPEANAARLRTSARRLAIPELPQELFIESLRQLIAVDEQWVPPAGGEESLYLRPFVFATEPGLGVRPANEYRYLVIGSPAGAYFPRGIKPVSVWLSTEYVRACPGGTGAAKFGGNYAASLLAQAEAADARLRPGGVAGRDRTPLCRGDGRHEPVLRVRQRWHRPSGDPGAVRLAAAGYHPGFIAAVGN